MNYIRIDKDNLVNGPGIRLVLWVSGCDRQCPFCHNPESWDKDFGNKFDDSAKEIIFKELEKSYYRGITITGGDPLFQENRETINSLLKEIKEKFPEKDIWVWTGHILENLIPDFFKLGNESSNNYELVSKIDVLVDGPFIKSQREIDQKNTNSAEILKYRGSSNQRIINIKKTLNQRRIVYYG